MGKTKYAVDVPRLLELYGEGHGNREIARRLDIPHWTVGRELHKRNLVTNVARGAPPRPLGDGLYECNKCFAAIHLEDFPYVQGKVDGRRLSYCRSCRRMQSRLDLGADPERYWADKRVRILRNGRGIPADIPTGYLFDLWARQDGKCFYTDVDLVHRYGEGRSQLSPSVDRVDTTRGYVVGNLVICSARANSIKHDATLDEVREWMPGWHQRIVDAGFID